MKTHLLALGSCLAIPISLGLGCAVDDPVVPVVEAGESEGDTDAESGTTAPLETETSGEPSETDTETDTDTDTDTGESTETDTGEPEPPVYPDLPEPVPAEVPCSSRELPPERVIGAFTRSNYDTPELTNALFFVRADGTRELIAESLEHRYRIAHGRGERVLVDVYNENGGEGFSTLHVLERQTGAELWTHDLEYPTVFRRFEVLDDGRILTHQSNFDYTLFDAEGAVLISGVGKPFGMSIREDGWIPLVMTNDTYNNVREDFQWAHAESGEILQPSFEFAEDPAGVRYTPSGELIYPAVVEGQWSMIVEEPGELTIVPAPELAPLDADDWFIRLIRPMVRSIPGIEWTRHNNEWSFIAAQSPGDNEWVSTHALDPNDQLGEFPLTPPPGATRTPCNLGSHDGEGRLLWPWFDGVSTWVWRELAPGEWTRVGLPMQADKVDVVEIADTVIICPTDPQVFCDGIEWGALPPEAVELRDDECLYVRGEGMHVADSLWHVDFDPSGHCVARADFTFESGGDGWTLHDIERNESFVLESPGDIGAFTWFWD